MTPACYGINVSIPQNMDLCDTRVDYIWLLKFHGLNHPMVFVMGVY